MSFIMSTHVFFFLLYYYSLFKYRILFSISLPCAPIVYLQYFLSVYFYFLSVPLNSLFYSYTLSLMVFSALP
jgi:hypothetical protein